jgi:lysozyme family protein
MTEASQNGWPLLIQSLNTFYMADFRTSYAIVRQNEGGYANNPNDRGGETYKGIARKFWEAWQGWKIIDSYKPFIKNFEAKLEEDEPLQAHVFAFFKANFWNQLRLDDVNSQEIANELFDTAVNMSVHTAGEFLQRSLNVLNINQKLFSDLLVDGKIGQKTIAALNSYPSPTRMLKVLNCLQGAKYVGICEANPSQEVFMSSWFSRVSL